MPDQDPLEELFRRNEGRMDQRPSLRTWRRLENRLDGRNGRRTQGPFRPWMYAAAVLVLFVTMYGLSQNSMGQENILAQQPESIEELGNETISTQHLSPYESIAEGDRTQVLQVRNADLPQLLPAPKYRL